MPDYMCILQEGQTPHQKQDALAQGLRRIGEASFGDEPGATEIAWTYVKPGFAWTAGEPSHSSIVVRSVPEGLSQERREAFLHAVCDLWMEVTGCSVEEIVVTAWDGPLPA